MNLINLKPNFRQRALAAALVSSAALFALSPAGAVTFSTPDGVAGQPRTSTAGGASRGDRCLAGAEATAQILPLLPNTQRVLTVADRPTFFVYVPPMTATIASFSLQDATSEHYRTRVELPEQGGIVSVTLPEDAPELQLGKDYKWYFELHCVSELADPDNPTIEGVVYRMPVEADLARNLEQAHSPVEKAQAYGDAGVWYDALSTLALAREARPQDSHLAASWNELLASVGLENLAQAPLAD
ncbi:MAG: DUF928 domain-containing protein [Cyanobacteria bacterium SID2]|nr:DUF928 domain-containing protein [Cyanobacteria bacterium SID2]MBP0003620.1 DUF928 domain-containing protein [Cyanobacteria bacterium SBC]